MEEVEEICTKIAIIDHGKIIAEGTKEQLKSIITDTKDIWIEVKSVENLNLETIKRDKWCRSCSSRRELN